MAYVTCEKRRSLKSILKVSQCGWYRGKRRSRPEYSKCVPGRFYTKISGTVRCTFKVHRWEGEINMMEFVEGVKAKETLGIAQILEGSYEGKRSV